MSPVYNLYVSTFVQVRSALQQRDDARLHAICREVAQRNGIESTVSLLAVSDAEHGGAPRRRAAVLWHVRHFVGALPQAAERDEATQGVAP